MRRIRFLFLNVLLVTGYIPSATIAPPNNYKVDVVPINAPAPIVPTEEAPFFLTNIKNASKSGETQNKLGQKPKRLEIRLAYNKPSVTITDARVMNGKASKDKQRGEYTLKLLNKKNEELVSFSFDIPKEVHSPPPLPGERPQLKKINLDRIDFAVTIGWHPEGKKVIIKKSKGDDLISSFSLNNIKIENNPDKYSSTPGQKFRKGKYNKNQEAESLTYTASPQDAMDIAVIGDKYTDLDLFRSDANNHAAFFMTFEPFKSRSSQIVFHYIDNTVDLGCYHHPAASNIVLCDSRTVIREVNNSGAPYDFIFLIVNDGQYGGGTTEFATATTGLNGEEVLVHESGHLIGHLLDEYSYGSNYGPIDNTAYFNCYAGYPPATEWEGIVNIRDYRQGCSYANHFRSSPTSIMLALSTLYFNAVSQNILNDIITFFAGPPAIKDITPPTSRIITPVSGARVANTIQINAVASDDNAVARTELWINNTLFQTDYIAPFSFEWDTTAGNNGYHTLVVKAYDNASNIGASPVARVYVNNVFDRTPPTVSILFPRSGMIISGFVTINVAANDNSGTVSKVELYKDRVLFKTITEANGPFNFDWDVEQELPGNHLLQAKAYDANGNARYSAILKIKVDNSVDEIPPTILIKRPLNNQKFSTKTKSMRINTLATDNKGIAKVEIFLDNGLVETCFVRSCSSLVTIASLSAGSHVVSVRVYDPDGNVSDKSVTFYKS